MYVCEDVNEIKKKKKKKTNLHELEGAYPGGLTAGLSVPPYGLMF